jgi:predicted permease
MPTWGDVRYALRLLAGTPGVTLAAILSLALGIGANSAIFSVASALLLRPLPYAAPDALVILWNRSPGLGIVEDWFSTAQYFDVRSGNRSFSETAIAIGGNDTLTGDGEPERIGTIRVSASLLPMLGTQPLHGRLFTVEEDRTGAAPTAILGHGTWTRRFGGDPAAVGRTLVVNGVAHRVVGVLPASFTLPRDVMPTLNGAEDAELVLPLPLGPDAPTFRGREDYNILARLKPGVTVARAQADMDAITARLREAHPDLYPPNGGLTFGVVPLADQVVGDVRRPLWILMAAVGVVLLIACANVANLLLGRALARHREMAVRAAIGASRGRIVRQLLTESLVLAAGGGLAGLVVGRLALAGIHALGRDDVPRLETVGLDAGVVLFTGTLAVACGLLFGLAPAWRLGRVDLTADLKDAARGASGSGALWRRGHGLRRLLVAGQLALCVMLVVGAGLLVRSFARLQAVPPGFNPAGTLTFELAMQGQRYPTGAKGHEAYRALMDRLRATPGVTAAGAVSALPLSQMFAWGPITVEGRVPPAGERFINADMRFVQGDYFRAMEIPVIDGRLFTDADRRPGPLVMLVDARMAADLWPGQSPIGKRVRLGGSDDTEAPWITVVGVVGRVKQYTLDGDSRIALYLPHAQFPTRVMNVVVRSSIEPAALASAARRAVRDVDPNLPLYKVVPMADRVHDSLARRRFAMLLLVAFAAVALGLAVIGTYGVMAYLVSQGTRELAIRLALGATPGQVVRLIVGQGLVTAAAGVGAGVLGSLLTARLLEGQLFEVAALDPPTFATVPLALLAVAAAACLIPAWRAARIDPAVSLNAE